MKCSAANWGADVHGLCGTGAGGSALKVKPVNVMGAAEGAPHNIIAAVRPCMWSLTLLRASINRGLHVAHALRKTSVNPH